MDRDIRDFVAARANGFCEYCRVHQSTSPFIAFHVEHIVASQHQQNDLESNLAPACDRCNAYKGPNLTTIDENTGEIVPLFHPRKDRWLTHFEFLNGRVIGRTAIGTATVRLLNMNASKRVQLRLLTK